MMRFAGTFGFVLAVVLATGCNRQCFLSQDVYNQVQTSMLPPSAELDYSLSTKPLTELTTAPPTVNTPDRAPRYLSLQEAIAIALESGTASTATLNGANGPGSGLYNTGLVTTPPTFGSSTQPLTGQTDNIRVISMNPAIAGNDIESALSRFDASWITSMNWTTTDNLLQGLNSFQNGETAILQSSIVKALSSGGFVSTTFQQNYQYLTQPPTGAFSILNPLYTSQLILGFEQPLWRNYGERINQLISGTPSPTTGVAVPPQVAGQYAQRQLGPLSSGGFVAADGILIARLRFDQSRAEFERVMQGLVLQVEVAYWNLYNAYGQLYSYEESLRVAHRAWMIAHALLQAGTIVNDEYAPVRGQYEDYRTQRATALGLVLDSERNLRGIIGLPVDDGTRIVPITPPTQAHFEPDWQSAMRDALTRKPELLLARDNLKLAQYNLEVAQNYLKPDIRFAAQYTPLGFGTALSGGGTFVDATGATQPNSSLKSLANGNFANYTVGLNAFVPLGLRLETASLRTAKLSVAQNYYLVKDQEQKLISELTRQFQKMQQFYKLIETTRAARKSYAASVDTRFKKIVLGKSKADISFLEFQTRLTNAQIAEYNAITEYNNTLARFEWTKGAILKYNNVHVAEGPLPQCVQVRAVDNEKQRTRALVLAERPDPLAHPGRLAHTEDVPSSDAPLPLPFLNQPPKVLPSTGETNDKVETMPAPKTQPADAPVAPLPEIKAPSLSGPVSAPAAPAVIPAAAFVPAPAHGEPIFKALPPAAATTPPAMFGPITPVSALLPEANARPALSAMPLADAR